MSRGRVEWHLVDREHGTTWFFTSRFAPRDQVLVKRGDEHQYIGKDTSGRKIKGQVVKLLRGGGELWLTQDVADEATVIEADDEDNRRAIGFCDIRALDLSVDGGEYPNVHSALWRSDVFSRASEIAYDVRTEATLHVVTARSTVRSGRTVECTYWLDAARGWCPVRTALKLDGRVLRESRMQLKQYGTVWFPSAVARFSSRFKDGKKPVQEIIIDAATFGDACPSTLSPSDVGIDAGAQIQTFPRGTRPSRLMRWDGERAVSFEEFNRRIASGELKYGPSFLRWSQRTPAERGVAGHRLVEAIEKELEGWDEYVARFCREPGVTPAQCSSAKAICESCRRQVRAYTDQKKNELDALEDDIRAMAFSGKAGESQRAEIVRRREKLLAPVRRIGDTELRPRIAALKTDAQRREDQTEPASQPSTTHGPRPSEGSRK